MIKVHYFKVNWSRGDLPTLHCKMTKQPPNFLLTSFDFSLLSTSYNVTKMTSKRPRWVYSEDSIANARLEVTDNNIFLTQAASKHGVPKQTLSDRFNGRRALAD